MESTSSLVLHIVLPVVAAIAVNLSLYLVKEWRDPQKKANRLLPPGPVIGVIWIVLLGLLGYARYRLMAYESGRPLFAMAASWALIVLIVFCLAYSFITRGMRKNVKVVNTVSLILAAATGAIVIAADPTTYLFVLPTVLWAGYVNLVDTIDCDGKP
jgi:tryptophan-rich sensory protein